MDNTILYAILTTSLIWLLIALGIYISYLKKVRKILSDTNENLRVSYEKGYQDSQEKKEFSVQISPWKEEVDSSNFFKNKKSVKIGYKYQLFSNGLPCLEPHKIVVDEMTVDSLNEENVERAFSNLELVMNNIPNTGNLAISILGNGKDLAKNLLRLGAKKK